MPVMVRWFEKIPHTVMVCLNDRWAWPELHEAGTVHIVPMARTLAFARAHVLLDFTHSTSLPDDASAQFRAFLKRLPANRGLVVVAASQVLVRVMIESFMRANPAMCRGLHLVTSREAAALLIGQADRVSMEAAGD